MANVQKYTRRNITNGSLFMEYGREKDEHGEIRQFGNRQLDPDRSHLNYNLAPEHENGRMAFLEQRLSEVKCLNREDVNIMCTWAVTVPISFAFGTKMVQYESGKKEVAAFEDNDPAVKRFFEETYEFLCDKYGEKNVVSCFVHMDETTPHMHFSFVPVVTDKKKGHEKVSAKEALGWNEKGLHKFHGELEAHMIKVFGMEVGILNDATKDGNKTTKELKRDTEIALAKAELESVIRPIEGNIAHEKRINAMIDGMKESKHLVTGKVRTVITFDGTGEEAMTVLNAAKDRDKMRRRRITAVKERDESITERDCAVEAKTIAEEKLHGIEQREYAVTEKELKLTELQAKADILYQNQLNLNQIHEQALTKLKDYKDKLSETQIINASLTRENGSILVEKEKDRENYLKMISELQAQNRGAYESLVNVVQAVGMLKYDKDDGYAVMNLNKKQELLIDAVANYAAKWAKSEGYHDLAEEAASKIGISKGIQEQVIALMPKSREFER